MAEFEAIDPGVGGPASLPGAASTSFDWAGLGSSLSAAGTGANISAAGYGAQALAQLAQGLLAAKRAKKIASYNADIAEQNAVAQAQAAEIEAQQYIRRAAMTRREQLEAEQLAQTAQAYREERQREQDQRILGQTRAIVASSGLMMSGSPLAVYEETARQQELDILATRYQTALQIRQGRMASAEQVTQDEYAAELARYGAGERLRVGRAQGGLLREQADTSGRVAGLLGAAGSLTQGAAAYGFQTERRKSQTILQ